MAVLFVGLADDIMVALIARLTSQGDQVRAIENDPDRAARWREHGVFVAKGDARDPDLVERAAQNVRTVVFGERITFDPTPALSGAKTAGVERVIWCARRASPEILDAFERGGIEHTALLYGRGFTSRGRAPSPEALAAAIDAADDIETLPGTRLQLKDVRAWRALGLDPPAGG